MSIMKGAEPFLLPGSNQKGVLLVHGFTGSPAEMRPLGKYLHDKGYTILAPRLAGHGSSIEEMKNTATQHWYSSVEDGYQLLKCLCSRISIVGLSMGGLLSIKLAHEYAVERLVSLSTPVYLTDRRLPLLPLYSLVRDCIPKKRKNYEAGAEFNICYHRTPLKGVRRVLDLITDVQLILPEIRIPSLIIQSTAEHTVKPESAQYLYDHIGGSTKKLVWLKKSGHVITLDIERHSVFAMVEDFLKGGNDNV